MNEPTLTVVIPTRDRRPILEATLAALAAQQGYPEPFEVIVVDDGSEENTSSWLDDAAFESFELRQLRTEGVGPAGARNLGVAHARAGRILLLGDDTIPQPTTLTEHRARARGLQVGVQGRIDWDPSFEITPVMRFLAPAGPQFWFKGLRDGDPVPFTGVYGSNLSAPIEWFQEEPFDESFRTACFEDTEQAWRWSQRGWQVIFGEQAQCLHRHHYADLDPVLRRQRRAGSAIRFTVSKHPRLFWPLFGQPLMMSGIKALMFGCKKLVGRTTFQDLADLRCRAAWIRGLLTSH